MDEDGVLLMTQLLISGITYPPRYWTGHCKPILTKIICSICQQCRSAPRSAKNCIDFKYIIMIYIDPMVKPKKILENCTGFEWDQGNLTKNWDQRDVLSWECEQLFFNRPLIVKRDKEHSQTENRYYVLGRTNVSRLLFAVFTVRNNKIRIISARDMTDAEIERYLK